MDHEYRNDAARYYFRSKGLRLKMLLSFMLLTLVTTLIMFALTYSNSQQLATEKIHHRIDLLATIFAKNIDSEILLSRRSAERFAADEKVRSLKEGDTLSETYARQYLNATGFEDADILLKSESGTLNCMRQAGNDLGKELCNAPETARAMNGGKTTVFTLPKAANSRSLFIAAPIKRFDGEVGGLVLVEKKLNAIQFGSMIQEKSLGRGEVYGYLVDFEGDIIAGRNRKHVGKNIFSPGMPLFNNKGLLPKMERPGIEAPFYYKGIKYLGSAAPVNPDLGWRVIIYQPYAEVYEAVRRLSLRILVVGGLALLVAFGLAMYRSHRIIAPIGDLLDAADEIASGEYGKRVKVHRRDEVGSLALAFNRMSAALQEKITAHQQSQEQLKETFHQLQIDSRKRERKVRELMSISEITSAISNSLDINIVLTTIIKTINNVMGFPVCSIKLLAKDDESLMIMVSSGLPQEYVNRAPTKLGQGVSGQAVAQRRGIVIEDLENDERVSSDHVLRTLGIKSMCCIPLMTKQSALGALNIYTREQYVFSEDEMRLLSTLANQASSALENARLFDQLQIDALKRERKVRELMSISEITSAISNSLDINVIMTTITKTISEVMGFSVCSIKLLDKDTELLEIMVSNGLSDDHINRTPTKLGRGISGKAVEERRSIVIENIPEDPRVPPDHDLRRLGIKSLCCIPLMTKQSVLGALNIYTKEPYTFSEDEMRLLSILANQASSAIENARLFDQLQIDAEKRERKVRELMSISEITSAISNSLDINVVLTTIMKTIVEVMDFPTCSIKLLDSNTGTLAIMVSNGLADEHITKTPTKLGEGISGKAVESGSNIVVENIAEDGRVPANHILRTTGVTSLCCIPLMTKQSALGALNIYTKERHVFSEDEMRLLTILANQAASAIENARLFDDLRENYFNTIEALSMTIDAKDAYTHGHSKRVSEISVLIGKQMELKPEDIQMIKHAGDLHDIGKIGISEAIIGKEGKLTVDEYEIIKTHPLVGETIIEPVPFLKEVKKIIRHHHERHDGYGYPDGIQGMEIPLMARILHLADAYDAMTSDRPYRKALSREMAIGELSKHSGTQFDPAVVDAFLQIDGEAFADI